MRKPYMVLAGLAVLTAACTMGFAQADDQFTETAPPKVPVGLMDASPETPVTPEQTPGVEKTAIEKKIAAVGQSMGGADTGEEVEPVSAGQDSDPNDFSPGGALLNGLMALCAVLALFFILVYLGKRFGKRTPLLAGQQLGQVMGRVSLTPQASLHFVRTNGEVLVVGVTQHSVNLIRTFDEGEFGPAESRAEVSTAPAVPDSSFLEQLRDVQSTMPAMPKGVDEDLDMLKGDLQRLQKYIQESARARE